MLSFGLSAFHHQVDDLAVGLLHAEAGELSDIVDRVFHALFHNAFPAEELISVLIHGKPQKTCVNSSRNLGGTACLGTVAYDPGSDCNSIDHGMCNHFKTAALEKSDSGTGSDSGTDGSAVG